MDTTFAEFVVDQLSELPNIRLKRMFGGFGVYSGDTFFAIISDGVLYFKTNEETREKYREEGSQPFAPSEKQVLKNYYEVPADVLEDREKIKEYAQEAIEVSETQ